MYEARQKKEKVSRKIGGNVRKKVDQKYMKMIFPIQRMIGFEFETGWEVKLNRGKIQPINENEFSYELLRTGLSKGTRNLSFRDNYAPLKKADLIYSNSQFTIEADEADNGKSEIEFVTKPVSNKKQLNNIMTNLFFFADYFISCAKDSNKRNYAFDEGAFRIIPFDKKPNEMKAGPQYTFGLPLNKIIKHAGQKSGIRYKNLEGLIFLLKEYIKRGIAPIPLEYPKQIADNFMLARTDFASLFNLAIKLDGLNKSNSLFDWFSKNPKLKMSEWLSYFTEFDLDKQLFQCRIFSPDDTKRERNLAPNLTIRYWLTQIYNNIDELRNINDSESLGSYGDKYEKTPSGDGGIFEQRYGQGEKIEHNLWKKYAIEKFDYISNLTAVS